MYALIYECKGIHAKDWEMVVVKYDRQKPCEEMFKRLCEPGFGPVEYRNIRRVKILSEAFCEKGESTNS